MAEIPSLYEKKITCTFCEHTFQTMKVRTRALKVKKNETYILSMCAQNADSHLQNNSLLILLKKARMKSTKKLKCIGNQENFLLREAMMMQL